MPAHEHLSPEQLQLFVAPPDANYKQRLYDNMSSMGFPSPKHALLSAATQSERALKKWSLGYLKTHESKLL